MLSYLWVGIGGFIGAVLRYSAMVGISGLGFRTHWATLLVNVVGCALIGVLAARFNSPEHPARLFWIVGALGGFTTFSTFSLDVLVLFEQRAFIAAAGHILLHLVLCLTGVWCGWKLYKCCM